MGKVMAFYKRIHSRMECQQENFVSTNNNEINEIIKKDDLFVFAITTLSRGLILDPE